MLVAARERGRDHLALKGQRIALDREASGINAVVRERTALAVYDAERSTVVNRRLNEIARAKSCVFVPVRAGEAVIGVVFGAVRQSRVFGEDELTRMQALVSEAGPALERSRATVALADALERERLISHISLELRSGRDVDEVLPVVLGEVGAALGAARSFVRLGEEGDGAIAAEWNAEEVAPIGADVHFPVADLCAAADAPSPLQTCSTRPRSARRRTATSASSPTEACARSSRRRSSSRSGCSACSRSTVRSSASWRSTEIGLVEAVAREAAIALDASTLLRESNRRLAEQQALLKAGEALTSELHFDTVIERLVQELRGLVNADAADCWTLLPGGSELVCRAVLGLPETQIGRTVAVGGTIGEAITSGKPVLRRDFAATEQPPPGAATPTSPR